MRLGLVTPILLAILACATPGCTTVATAPDDARETRELKIRAGDEIRIVTTNRDRLSLKVERVLDDRFVGVTVEPAAKEKRAAGTPVEVPYPEIAMIEVTRFDPGAVAGVGSAVVFTVALGVFVLTGVPVVIPP
jgi:hypothetical protein